MAPLPYPHRVAFLATSLVVPPSLARLSPYLARLISVLMFDHFVRHPILTLGDDDDRLADESGRLLDAQHPNAEDTFDWLLRISRRQEVVWFQLSFDPQRPAPAVLYARRPNAHTEQWFGAPDSSLSAQISQCLGQWLAARRLLAVGPLPEFTLDDLRTVAGRLANADAVLAQRAGMASVPPNLIQAPPRLGIPYLRVLAELSRDAARTFDPKILELDPTHPVARRNHYVSGLLRGEVDRRAILPLIAEAPMYGKPHLSIWGEPFGDRPLEGMGVRHQGIAASLMPANPYACHNYSLQLADAGRIEESYRWADRATVAAPQFGTAHLDCVRRIRQVGRPGQAFAEAQYRAREILDRAAAGKLGSNDGLAPHHAAMLVAIAHYDVGRLAEAIELASDALARLPADAATQDTFGWAATRVEFWRTDPGVFARTYAREAFYRGDPGRAITALVRGRISDDEDAASLLQSLVAIGREDEAEVAFFQCAGQDGTGQLGDGKARLAGAQVLILSGQLELAMDQLQIVSLRRSQSRLDGELHRVLRLAATQPAVAWNVVIERRLERGALRLARLAARDLADFVPGLDAELVERALGPRAPLAIAPAWLTELVEVVPGKAGAIAAAGKAVLARLTPPSESTLAAADALVQDWTTALVPAHKDREAHAACAVIAAGIAIAQYLAAATAAPTPIAGAYRYIAIEALQLVRRARYQIDPAHIRALLRLVERLAPAPDWLLDTWLLRIERALDLEAEHGAYLDDMITGMPTVKRLLRGDERIGWELRLAHDLAADPSQYEAAETLFERCARAVEGGSVPRAWSAAAAAGARPEVSLDVHWLAALANPVGVGEPWLALAIRALADGNPVDGFPLACRAMTALAADRRAAALDQLAPHWHAANVATPLDGAAAYEAGTAAAAAGRLDDATAHLAWAVACDPALPARAHALSLALVRAGDGLLALRTLAAHERTDAPRLVGRALLDHGRPADAVRVLRYASRRFSGAEDWAALALAASRTHHDAIAVAAGRRAIAAGNVDAWLLTAYATGLYRLGEFVACEQIAQQLIAMQQLPRDYKIAALHAMARALAGQGRHVDAHPYAKAALDLGDPDPDSELPGIAAELRETMNCIVAQEAPPVHASAESTMERQAFHQLETADFEPIANAASSPSWPIARAAMAAAEFRKDDESGIPVARRALEAAASVLARSEGATSVDAVLARIRALRVRDNAFIQLDPPPPLGLRYTAVEFERELLARRRRIGAVRAVTSSGMG